MLTGYIKYKNKRLKVGDVFEQPNIKVPLTVMDIVQDGRWVKAVDPLGTQRMIHPGEYRWHGLRYVHPHKEAANARAYAIGQKKNGRFHVRRVVWGKLLASHERRDGEEIRPSTILVSPINVKPVKV